MIIDLPLFVGPVSSKFGIRCLDGQANSVSSWPSASVARVYPIHRSARTYCSRSPAGSPRSLPRGRVQMRQVRRLRRHHCSITSNGSASTSAVPGAGGGGAGAAGPGRAGIAARRSTSRRALRVAAAAVPVISRICSTIANRAFSSTSARPSSRSRATAACCSHALIGGRDSVR